MVASTSVHGSHIEYKVEGPGVVTGRSGSLGTVLYLDEPFWPLNTTLWVKDFKGNVPRYVYYFLQTLGLEQYNAGTGVPTLNRNHLDELPLRIHLHEEQVTIARILEAYDELIENNLRRIEILEEMAETIDRQWFVNFRLPEQVAHGVPDPKEWERRNLFDIANVRYGFGFKSSGFHGGPSGRRVVRIRDVPKDTTSTYSDEDPGPDYEVLDGDILVGMDGDFHMCVWHDGEAMLNQRVARFRPIIEAPALWLFHALKEPIKHFNATITGTTVAHLGDRHLRTVELLVPPPSLLAPLKHQLDPIEELIRNLHRQNANLRTTRDLLLPKLISGEIDVSDLDIDTSWLAA